MNKPMNLQDVFLNQARKEKITVTIYLTNVILDAEGKQNLVYKHAISTIIPSKSISILDGVDRLQDGDE